MMEAVHSSETLAYGEATTRRNNPEDHRYDIGEFDRNFSIRHAPVLVEIEQQ
jgi:hypothetical protein